MKEKKLGIGKCIGLCVVAYLIRESSSIVGSLIAKATMSEAAATGYPAQVLCAAIGFVLWFGFLFVAGRKKILTQNMSRFGKGLLIGLFSLSLSCLIFGINVGSAFANKTGIASVSNSVWFTIAILLSAGIGEEVLFRGCFMNFVRDAAGRDTKKGLYISIIISSILFGAIHILNYSIVGWKIAVYQAIMASFMGFYLAAVYARSRCLWVTIFLHFFHDFAVMFTAGFLGGNEIGESIGGTMSGVNPVSAMINFVMFVGTGLYLLRKSKISECFEEDEDSKNTSAFTEKAYAG